METVHTIRRGSATSSAAVVAAAAATASNSSLPSGDFSKPAIACRSRNRRRKTNEACGMKDNNDIKMDINMILVIYGKCSTSSHVNTQYTNVYFYHEAETLV